MYEWNETHQAIRDAVRRFVEAEIKPSIEALEHGDTPPYEILRRFMAEFGVRDMALAQFDAQIARDRAKAERGGAAEETGERAPRGMDTAMRLIPVIEISRYSPGMITAMGVSVGLTAAAIMSRGTIRQKERWARDLLTLDKIGAWAITEPGSGSDAFGGMRSTARRDGAGGYILNGSKTFITNGPYADTIVFICKLDDGETPPERRKVVSFVLDKGTLGLTQSKPLRKMGMHSSPTGELFLEDVRVGADRLIGETEDVPARAAAKDTFAAERTGVAAMALGIVEQCLKLSTEYAKTRVQFGKPIGEFQLIQLKLAKMEVARMNIQNMVFRQIELAAAGKAMGIAEASACKLYTAQATMEVCLEAVQLFGGNGYMAEYQVEQLCRDAKVLQIYGGTDEIQVSQIARSLLAG
ncbi:MAG: acyl-CoA dehydrogenase family protein [Deltaproteobacteria bacterium]|nr:acyl-CoA dehydrogenase family protein [Myxococcales bacterium]MDP3220338.1 acyl-CoA dehydrogenase family protein [Deltaproteobacteria bacterium]